MPETIKRYFKGDRIIWALFIVLAIISILSVYSSVYRLAYRQRDGQVSYFMVRHIIYVFVGFVVAYLAHLVQYKKYSKLALWFIFAAVILLILTIFFGEDRNDTHRWLTIFGISFQTSDFAKLAGIMFVARQLSLRQQNVDSFWKGFAAIILPVLIVCGLIMPANLSTALILFVVSIILMFIGRIKFSYIISFALVALALLTLFIFIACKMGWSGRWTTWCNRMENYSHMESQGNYQAEQSKIAIATGGVLGKGPGNSMQRGFIPEPHSDFIYSIIVEEYGLLGALLVISIYLALLYRAGLIVKRSNRAFAAFLAFGLAMLIVLQAMVNMAVAVGLLPVTGQPLPLISKGGTSMVFTSMAIGMILSVSYGVKEKEKEEEVDA